MKFKELGCVYVLISVLGGDGNINVALFKPAHQSTLFVNTDEGMSGDAYKAVDGDVHADFLAGSCSHTLGYKNSWWEVDLQSTYDINELVVYNRDVFGYRLGNYIVSGGVNCNSTSKCYTECYHYHQIPDMEQYLTITNCIARYVRITSLLVDGLTLCEVQVFGELDPELSATSIPDELRSTPLETAPKSAVEITTTTESKAFVSPRDSILFSKINTPPSTPLEPEDSSVVTITTTQKSISKAYPSDSSVSELSTTSIPDAPSTPLESEDSSVATITTTTGSKAFVSPRDSILSSKTNTTPLTSLESEGGSVVLTTIATKNTEFVRTKDSILSSKISQPSTSLESEDSSVATITTTQKSISKAYPSVSSVSELSTTSIPDKLRSKSLESKISSVDATIATNNEWISVNYPALRTMIHTQSIYESLTTDVEAVDIQETTSAKTPDVVSRGNAILFNGSSPCGCFCRAVYQKGPTKEFIAEIKAGTKKNLTVATEKLSSTIRKKTSATDKRPSAVYTGYIGIVLIILSLGSLILSDLISLIRFVHHQLIV